MIKNKEKEKRTMTKDKRTMTILVAALVLTLTIGFSLLTQTLLIQGTARVEGAGWSIHFRLVI